MRFLLLPVIVMLVFNGIIDFSIYRILKRNYKSPLLPKIQAVTAVLLALLLVVLMCMPKRGGSEDALRTVMWGGYAYLTIYVPKYIFLVFYFIAKLPQLWRGRLLKPLSMAGAVVAVIVFILMWWGALINRFNIQVNDVDVHVASLPEAFDGFRIAQISDMHVGTYGSDTAFVAKLVEHINALEPDLIVFTGDMVNRQSDEFVPFVSTVSHLKAKYGVYSVLGNHDYGDYRSWDSEADKAADVQALKDMEGRAGMHPLNNEHVWIHCGADSIALIGVENIGDPPFTVYGDLHQAYPDIDDPNTKILLSHNPAHWEAEIEDQATNVALTLSGHTHAMQCEVFGLSPAALRYDKWGGLYTDTKGQALYVNIGAGTVGMPYRIGATPEITMITLRK